jgi:hypothetical protein
LTVPVRHSIGDLLKLSLRELTAKDPIRCTYFFWAREVVYCTAVALRQNPVETRPGGPFAAMSRVFFQTFGRKKTQKKEEAN